MTGLFGRLWIWTTWAGLMRGVVGSLRKNTLQGVEFAPVIHPEWCDEYPASKPNEDHIFLEFEDDRITRMVELKQDGLLYVHVCIGETELTIKIEGNNA